MTALPEPPVDPALRVQPGLSGVPPYPVQAVRLIRRAANGVAQAEYIQALPASWSDAYRMAEVVGVQQSFNPETQMPSVVLIVQVEEG